MSEEAQKYEVQSTFDIVKIRDYRLMYLGFLFAVDPIYCIPTTVDVVKNLDVAKSLLDSLYRSSPVLLEKVQ